MFSRQDTPEKSESTHSARTPSQSCFYITLYCTHLRHVHLLCHVFGRTTFRNKGIAVMKISFLMEIAMQRRWHFHIKAEPCTFTIYPNRIQITSLVSGVCIIYPQRYSEFSMNSRCTPLQLVYYFQAKFRRGTDDLFPNKWRPHTPRCILGVQR